MATYHEQNRPQTLDDVVGQDAAVSLVRRLIERSPGGRAWWINGASGTGKTTIARIIGKATARDVVEVDSQRCTLDFVRDMADYFRILNSNSLFATAQLGKVWIFNEAHNFRASVLNELLTTLEPEGGIPDCCAVIFTTTNAGQKTLFADFDDAMPLLSRCTVISLVDDKASRMERAARAKALAMKDGIDGQPLEVYIHALNAVSGNMRLLLSDVENGRIAELAAERAALERELAMIRATKSAAAETRREEIKRLLGM